MLDCVELSLAMSAASAIMKCRRDADHEEDERTQVSATLTPSLDLESFVYECVCVCTTSVYIIMCGYTELWWESVDTAGMYGSSCERSDWLYLLWVVIRTACVFLFVCVRGILNTQSESKRVRERERSIWHGAPKKLSPTSEDGQVLKWAWNIPLKSVYLFVGLKGWWW